MCYLIVESTGPKMSNDHVLARCPVEREDCLCRAARQLVSLVVHDRAGFLGIRRFVARVHESEIGLWHLRSVIGGGGGFCVSHRRRSAPVVHWDDQAMASCRW